MSSARNHWGLEVWGGEHEDQPGTEVWRFSDAGYCIARAHLTPAWRTTAMGHRRKWYGVRLELRVSGHGRDWATVEGVSEHMRRDDLLRQLARQLKDGAWWREAELQLYDRATPRGLTYAEYTRATCTMQPVEAIRWLQDWLSAHPAPEPTEASPEAPEAHPDPDGCATGLCDACQAEAQADPIGHLTDPGHWGEPCTCQPTMTPEDAAALAWFDRGEPMTGPLPEGQVARLQAAGWLTFAPDSHRLVITLGGIEALAVHEARGDSRACHQCQCWCHDPTVTRPADPLRCCPWCGCSWPTGGDA